MLKLNREKFRDKVYACFIGKNIGGTMGTPYEGRRELQDIKGFVTDPGEVLPNDDLDLQLVWLYAVENIGPYGLDCKKLSEFWISYIVPYWNEYGLGKANLTRGLQAPLSGDYMNNWRDSNGAWIRTEIWAALAPASPALAAKYAIEDAKVDHGAGEGTIAAAFVAAMQSAAYAVPDVRKCIDIALTQIPATSRVWQSVTKVIECYNKGLTPVEARNTILELNSDMGDGWFESPSNVAYTVLGLVYGEGDFKKSMIYAINCGDDTDCTGATVGATLGIIGGTAGIPSDWRAYLGDNIITISLNRATGLNVPKTCIALTDRVISQTPVMLTCGGNRVALTDGHDEIPANIAEEYMNNGDTKYALSRLLPYSFTTELGFCTVTAIWDGAPDILPGGQKKVTLRFDNNWRVYGNSPYFISLSWLTPEGFTVEGKNSVRLTHSNAHNPATEEVTFTITAPEHVEPENRIVVEVITNGRPTPGYVSLVLLG